MTSDQINKPFNEWLTIQKEQQFVTSKAASAGTTLLTQAPLASVPQPSERHHRCNYCLRKGNLQRCSRCHSAYFCSNECFLKAWIHFHRGCCEEHDRDCGVPTNTDQWLLERAALTLHSHKSLIKTSNTSPIQLSLSIDAFDSLDVVRHTNMNKQESLIDATFDKLAPYFEKIGNQNNNNNNKDTTTDNETLTKEHVASLYQRAAMSRFTIQDPDMHLENIAVGLFPITRKYVGHSCRPNAGLFYYQGHQLLIALEDIPKDTPITVSYIDVLASPEERQQSLKEIFGPEYECDCSRCKGDFMGLDTLLEKGEATLREMGLTREALKQDMSAQLKSWSVLRMTKEYAVKEFKSIPESLDVPHLTHFLCRLVAPSIYIPIVTGHSNNNNQHSQHSPLRRKSSPDHHYQPYPQFIHNTIYNITKDEEYEVTDQILQGIIDTLLKIKTLPYFSLTAIRVAEEILEECVKQGSWVEASRCTIYLFMMYRLIYPALEPKMVYHNLVLARASWNSLVQLELAGIGKKLERIYQNGVRVWIELARKCVLLTLGQESSLWREVIEIQWLFERDQKLK